MLMPAHSLRSRWMAQLLAHKKSHFQPDLHAGWSDCRPTTTHTCSRLNANQVTWSPATIGTTYLRNALQVHNDPHVLKFDYAPGSMITCNNVGSITLVGAQVAAVAASAVKRVTTVLNSPCTTDIVKSYSHSTGFLCFIFVGTSPYSSYIPLHLKFFCRLTMSTLM